MRAGQIDAIANVEPAITMLERSGTIKVVIETMSERGSRAVFGDLLPSGSLYTKEEFIQRYPETTQALTNAIVRALKWLSTASAEDILKVIPAEYALGDRSTYLAALERSRPGLLEGWAHPAVGRGGAVSGAEEVRSGGAGGRELGRQRRPTRTGSWKGRLNAPDEMHLLGPAAVGISIPADRLTTLRSPDRPTLATSAP